MNLEEYHSLEKVERDHWFYRGKRELTKWWIDREAALGPKSLIVDCGAGTGELVKYLRESYGPRGIEVQGIEYEATAREIALERRGIDLSDGSILSLPVPSGASNVTISLDVLEHVEDDARALSEVLRITAPRGLVILNVPAFQSLWSNWDVSLGHHRRYTREAFKALLSTHASRVDVLYLSYANMFAFPPIWLYRKLQLVLGFESRAEDTVPPAWLNALLHSLYVAPTKLRWLRQPFGVSLFCVLRKK